MNSFWLFSLIALKVFFFFSHFAKMCTKPTSDFLPALKFSPAIPDQAPRITSRRVIRTSYRFLPTFNKRNKIHVGSWCLLLLTWKARPDRRDRSDPAPEPAILSPHPSLWPLTPPFTANHVIVLTFQRRGQQEDDRSLIIMSWLLGLK